MGTSPTKVLVFGTFDSLHKGHDYLLKQASSYGDELHVVLARDETVEKVKGQRPEHPEGERKRQLERNDYVKTVHLGSLTDKYALIKKIDPGVICLGYDQEAFVNGLYGFLSSYPREIRVVRIGPFEEKKYKSSLLRKK